MNAETIITALGGFAGGGTLTAIVSAWFNRKKTDADASTALVETVLKWANGLTVRIEALEKAVQDRDRLIADLQSELARLKAEIEPQA